MKKTLLTLVLLAGLFATPSFAQDGVAACNPYIQSCAPNPCLLAQMTNWFYSADPGIAFMAFIDALWQLGIFLAI